MAGYVIDRLTSALAKTGAGPVPTGMSLTISDQLDQAGAFTLTMPATDTRAASFTPNTLHYARGVVDGDASDFRRYGIIKERTTNSEAMTLSLSGPTLLGELLHTHVGTLLLQSTPDNPMLAANVLPAIIAFAPGWTTTGTPSKDQYYEHGDETVLSALKKLAERTGDHFRLSETVARQVEWLPTTTNGFDAVASGLRAVDTGSSAALESNDDVCLIVGGLQEVADGHQRITRLYPRGAGNAGERLYLNKTTGFGAPGTATVTTDYVSGEYTFHLDADPAQSSIKHTVNDAAGSISGVETFRDLAPLSETVASDVSAANMLFDATLVSLRRKLEEQRSYRLTLTKVRRPLLVGTTINVICRHFVDGYGWINVDDHALVLGTTWTWDAAGGEAMVDVEVTV